MKESVHIFHLMLNITQCYHWLGNRDACKTGRLLQKVSLPQGRCTSLMRAHHKCYLKMFITGLTNQLKSSNSKMYFVLVIALHGRAMKLHFFSKTTTLTQRVASLCWKE